MVPEIVMWRYCYEGCGKRRSFKYY